VKTAESEHKPTLLEQMGGVSGLIYASVPSAVFVIADAITGLHVAVAVAVGTGVAIAVLRMVRKEPIQPALSGLLGVGVGAFVAYQTGDAKDYFLVGIWLSFVAAVVFFVSVAFARIAMGHPLTVLALVAVVWAVRRSARSLDSLAAV
jgi:hypothetical protein